MGDLDAGDHRGRKDVPFLMRSGIWELIPADYGGVLVCDRGRSYDAAELEGVAQQKCLAHLIRNAAEVVEEKTGRARQFGRHLMDLLRQSLSLSARRTEMKPKNYRKQALALNDELAHLLRDRTLCDPDNQRLLNGVGAQNDRGRLLRFLAEDGVEPTNNRAERDLRPAVIAANSPTVQRTSAEPEPSRPSPAS